MRPLRAEAAPGAPLRDPTAAARAAARPGRRLWVVAGTADRAADRRGGGHRQPADDGSGTEPARCPAAGVGRRIRVPEERLGWSADVIRLALSPDGLLERRLLGSRRFDYIV